jgi:hypothetical protein
MEFPAEFLIQFSDVEKKLELTLIAVCCSSMKEKQKETRTSPICQPLSWDMSGHGVLNWWHFISGTEAVAAQTEAQSNWSTESLPQDL